MGEGVEIGTQWIGREVLFPQSGGQLRHLTGRVTAYPLQYIHQIVIGVDLVQAAGHDQGLCHPSTSGRNDQDADIAVLCCRIFTLSKMVAQRIPPGVRAGFSCICGLGRV